MPGGTSSAGLSDRVGMEIMSNLGILDIAVGCGRSFEMDSFGRLPEEKLHLTQLGE